jgi:tetratricopeptide (TPR) repeat protein
MIRYLRLFYWFGFIGLLMMVAVLTLSGCGSSAPRQDGPAVDADLERFNRAARQAFDRGKLRQAANFYRMALDRAYVRDDTAAILDAQYNLAICLMNLQSYEEALAVVQRAHTEMTLTGRGRSGDFLLLEATILQRRGEPDEAWKITDQILSTPTPASSTIKRRTHFLRGLIASDQADLDRLRAAITALGQPKELQLRADRQELLGRLAMAEQNWDAATGAFDATAKLRRAALDYRGMVRALVWGGEASEKAGRIREAATHFLRAGRSAFLQDQFDDAHKWLNRAAQLANTAGEDQIIQEARRFLGQIEASTATAPDGSAKKTIPAE